MSLMNEREERFFNLIKAMSGRFRMTIRGGKWASQDVPGTFPTDGSIIVDKVILTEQGETMVKGLPRFNRGTPVPTKNYSYLCSRKDQRVELWGWSNARGATALYAVYWLYDIPKGDEDEINNSGVQLNWNLDNSQELLRELKLSF